MNTKIYRSVVLMALLLNGCGGGGEDDLDNPLDSVPDLTPVPGLQGDWDLTLELTETNCANSSKGDTDTMEVTVTDTGCTLGDGTADVDDSDFTSEIKCGAGDQTLGISVDFSANADDNCTVKFSEDVLAELQDDGTLSGDFQGSLSISSGCPDDSGIHSCAVQGTVTGRRSTNTMLNTRHSGFNFLGIY
ncbi:MAG: hypothetical protein Q7T11_04115 [Deltaproteobacteria bacterium]|nr:hypothetical protein [Deltaproteobacteria bacterium]